MKKRVPFEYRITLTYIFFGALWILFSDKLVLNLTQEPQQFLMLSTYKGWLYVLITGILLYFLIKKEIVRRNNIQEQLSIAKHKAEEANNLKSAFLSNLSHYIRSPMNSILGFVDLLEKKDISPEKHQKFLKHINDRSHHLLQTINCIIEISKIKEGLSEVSNTNFKIYDLLNDVLYEANLEIEQRNKRIQIKQSFSPIRNDGVILSDRKIIFQILTQLLSNAINFSREGEITLGCYENENALLICIKDNGAGISADVQKILFTEFMYNNSQTYTLGEGAGLGLYLSHQLSKLIGAKLWLESTGSSGSKFCLSLPIVT
jgi:signal transduction histidine kinase